jgi:DNA-binding NtrC family response regulator
MALKAAHILVVDDDVAYAETVTNVLRRHGHEVQQVRDFASALQWLDGSEPVDILVTDIVMPHRVNGIALSRMALLRRPDVKVIYMTAYDIPGAEDEALGPLLRKPVEESRLVKEVERALT